jgi:superfamily I DNA/RNA helicase
MSAGIPFRLVGGQQFFQRREIKDAVAYLKLLVNPRDDQSVLRILAAPSRGIGPKAVKELKRRRAEEYIPMMNSLKNSDFVKTLTSKGSAELSEMLAAFESAKKSFETPGHLAARILAFLKEVGYYNGLQKIYRDHDDSIKRRDNVDEFINAVAQFEKKHGEAVTLADYLESYALMEENDRVQEETVDADAVTLSSIHAAKGLEYPVVVQIAMERNIFPHERALEENGYEEELRLFYVALTRAKEELYLTRCRSRMVRGVVRPALPSSFLELLGESAETAEPDDLIRLADQDTVRKTFEDAIRMLMEPDI